MRIRFSPQFHRMLQHLIIISIIMILVLAGTNIRLTILPPRILFVGIAALLFLAIGVSVLRKLHSLHLLASQVNTGWLAFMLATVIVVIVAPFPRRSLEIWLLTIGIQLVFAYGMLYLLRRGWSDRAIYRGMLAIGGYIYTLGTTFTLAYVLEWIQARINGAHIAPFRLMNVLDNASALAMCIAVIVPCIIGYAFTALRRWERVLIAVWLIGAFITLLASGTRSGTIAVIVGTGVSVFLSLLAHPKQPLSHLQHWIANHRRQAYVLVGIVVVGITTVLAGFFYILSNAAGHAAPSDRFELFRIAVLSFTQHPIAGVGIGGFSLAQQQVHSIPPFLMVPHAHNIVLNMAAEGGLIGLSGLVIFVALVAHTCFVVWHTQPERRPLIAGAIGGLCGFLATGLLESPLNQPGLFALASMLIMLISSRNPHPDKLPVWRVGLLLVSMAIIVVLNVLLLVQYSRFWEVAYNDFITLNNNIEVVQSDAEKLDQLLERDPSDPLVTLQSAYTWAHLAAITSTPTTANEYIGLAIQRLEQDIQYDPYLGLHYINLSALHASLGHNNDALRHARKGAELSYRDPAAWLNLGQRLEAVGETQDALEAYTTALSLEPRWAYAGFWQSSDSRKEALDQFNTLPTTPLQQYEQLLVTGDTARNTGADAATFYRDALAIAADPAQEVLAQGLIAWAEGNFADAQLKLTEATQRGGYYIAPDAWAYLATISEQRGSKVEMLEACNNLHYEITTRGIEGLKSANSVAYANNSFWRYGLVSDYVDEVVMLDITPRDVNCLKVLAQEKATNGDHIGAMQIYRKIVQANPLDQEAQSALADIQQQ